MSESNPQSTRVAADPSDSILIGLARAALADSGDAGISWPALDLSDPQQREFGDYELLEEIGRGGMGVVYRARQRSLDRDVAIKFIAAGFADSVSVARFLGEARSAARLLHPNIVPVHEVGSIDHVHYFSMPLIKGMTLASLLDKGPLAPASVIALMLKLCEAIDYAHRLGLLHLDLKPANVLLDARNEPLVADFGLARHMDASGGVDAQEVSGTPAFMAPEQVQIKQFRLTEATDLYSLGAILYFLLTGVSPHGHGNAQELMQNSVAGRIKPVRDIAPAVARDLSAICEHCLQLHGKDRYRTVAELGADLARFRDGNPVSVRSAGVIERLVRNVKRNPALALSSSLAVLALVLGLAASTWQWLEAESARRLADTQRREAVHQREVAEQRATQMKQLAAMQAATSPDDSYAAIEERQRRANILIEWLRTQGGSPTEQRALLGVFVEALRSAGKSGSVDSLIWEIPNQMGLQYRTKLSAQLAQTGGRDNLIAATVLMLRRSVRDAQHPDLPPLIARLNDEFGEDPLALVTMALGCNESPPTCERFQLRQRLRVLAPDFHLAWTYGYTSAQALDPEALAGMAKITTAQDAFPDLVAIVLDKVVQHPMPAAVTEPLRAVMSDHEAAVFEQRDVVTAMPVTNYGALMNACYPRHAGFLRRHVDDCLTVARVLFQTERAPIVAKMTGGSMLRRLLPGSLEAEQALSLRRQMLWIKEQPDRIDDQEAITASLEFDRETAQLGEWPALLRLAERRGIPSLQPPAGWQPQHPQDLLLPEERSPQR